MALEERGGNLGVHLTLDGTPHDIGLVLPCRENRDLASTEDRRDTHRDGLARDVVLAEEVRRRIAPRDRVERDESRPAPTR
jgi:hypothetical protein